MRVPSLNAVGLWTIQTHNTAGATSPSLQGAEKDPSASTSFKFLNFDGAIKDNEMSTIVNLRAEDKHNAIQRHQDTLSVGDMHVDIFAVACLVSQHVTAYAISRDKLSRILHTSRRVG